MYLLLKKRNGQSDFFFKKVDMQWKKKRNREKDKYRQELRLSRETKKNWIDDERTDTKFQIVFFFFFHNDQ